MEHLIAAHSLDINSRGGFHMTLLHAALVKEHLGVALLLVKHGADPNCQDDLGRVPLHWVSQGGKLIRVKSLHKNLVRKFLNARWAMPSECELGLRLGADELQEIRDALA